MIEKMKIVHIVAASANRNELLDDLRNLGILHPAEKGPADPAGAAEFDRLSRSRVVLSEYPGAGTDRTVMDGEQFLVMDNSVRAAMNRRADLVAQRDTAAMAADKIAAWGNFEPALFQKVKESGYDIRIYRMGKGEYAQMKADPDVKFVTLAPVEKMYTVATVGAPTDTHGGMEFEIPEKGLDQLRREVGQAQKGIEDCDRILENAASHLASYDAALVRVQNGIVYSGVNSALGEDSGLVWLSGYLPADDADKFREAAKENGWAYAMDDPAEEDEAVPTKIRYSKVTALMKPLFDILGTIPGYREYDISFWFLCFFALFFAIIIGDAGYGLIFLIGAAAINIKTKKCGDALALLYVLSGATLVWGAVTGAWFGLEGAMNIPFLKALVVPGFANYPQYFNVETVVQQNNIMKFCFLIGTIQLSLACILAVRRKIAEKNISLVADVAWFLSINALYYVVLFLVIGQSANLGLAGAIVGAGFVTVLVFGSQGPGVKFGDGIKSGLGNFLTTFLNTVSAFGNIMSYIRLFAVGMASLAIAQSFNNMASGFSGPLVIVGALIMIVGHTLNIVMGFLSVVVHGVRLNLLEFSGQLGMEWSGSAYEPFKNQDK